MQHSYLNIPNKHIRNPYLDLQSFERKTKKKLRSKTLFDIKHYSGIPFWNVLSLILYLLYQMRYLLSSLWTWTVWIIVKEIYNNKKKNQLHLVHLYWPSTRCLFAQRCFGHYTKLYPSSMDVYSVRPKSHNRGRTR